MNEGSPYYLLIELTDERAVDLVVMAACEDCDTVICPRHVRISLDGLKTRGAYLRRVGLLRTLVADANRGRGCGQQDAGTGLPGGGKTHCQAEGAGGQGAGAVAGVPAGS